MNTNKDNITSNTNNSSSGNTRSNLFNTVMKLMRDQRQNSSTNSIKNKNTINQKQKIVPDTNPIKPVSRIKFTAHKVIEPIKSIQTSKSPTKYMPIKKEWDPNHTTLAWKG